MPGTKRSVTKKVMVRNVWHSLCMFVFCVSGVKPIWTELR